MASRVTQQDVDLYGSLAQAAQQTTLKIDASATDWEKQIILWDQKTPSPDVEKRTKNSAMHTFDEYASIQKGAEKTLRELRGVIHTASDKLSYKEKLEAPQKQPYRQQLQVHEAILQTACQNINTSLPKARIALDALCKWKESLFAAGYNYLFGRPSHADSSSSAFSSRRSSMASASSASSSSVKSMEEDSDDDDYVMIASEAPKSEASKADETKSSKVDMTEASKAEETEASKAEARRQKNKAAHERARLRKAVFH